MNLGIHPSNHFLSLLILHRGLGGPGVCPCCLRAKAINLTNMSLDCGRTTGYPERSRTGPGRTNWRRVKFTALHYFLNIKSLKSNLRSFYYIIFIIILQNVREMQRMSLKRCLGLLSMQLVVLNATGREKENIGALFWVIFLPTVILNHKLHLMVTWEKRQHSCLIQSLECLFIRCQYYQLHVLQDS